MTTTKRAPAKKPAAKKKAPSSAGRALSRNGSGKKKAARSALNDAGADKRLVRRDAKTGRYVTEETTLKAFRMTYERAHPRKA